VWGAYWLLLLITQQQITLGAAEDLIWHRQVPSLQENPCLAAAFGPRKVEKTAAKLKIWPIYRRPKKWSPVNLPTA
jgi:hypothetical protein